MEVEIFDVWEIDFMGFFVPSNQNQRVGVDYVSKWVEPTTYPLDDAKVFIKFLKSASSNGSTLPHLKSLMMKDLIFAIKY